LKVPREMIRSPAYQALSCEARCLLIELQDVWLPDRPIHYSTRRMAKRLGASQMTVVRAFQEAQELGFLRLANESDWINGKAREWTLTWMSYNGREPSADWLEVSEKLGPTNHLESGQGRKRITSKAVGKNGRKAEKSPVREINDLGKEQIAISQKSESPRNHH
jgi:DNA-binding transcriptional MocR family regulator